MCRAIKLSLKNVCIGEGYSFEYYICENIFVNIGERDYISHVLQFPLQKHFCSGNCNTCEMCSCSGNRNYSFHCKSTNMPNRKALIPWYKFKSDQNFYLNLHGEILKNACFFWLTSQGQKTLTNNFGFT